MIAITFEGQLVDDPQPLDATVVALSIASRGQVCTWLVQPSRDILTRKLHGLRKGEQISVTGRVITNRHQRPGAPTRYDEVVVVKRLVIRAAPLGRLRSGTENQQWRGTWVR